MIFEKEILQALEDDRDIDFKSRGTDSLHAGLCPECNRREVFISISQPYRLMCNKPSCGYVESTRSRYSHLWANLSEKHPSTDADPHATAKAYMSSVRGFPLIKTERWFEQGTMKLANGSYADTVRFLLWDGCWWDRLINQKDILNNVKKGDKPLKADFKYGTQFRGKCWTPPGQVIEKGDTVYVVEGIFHAIAFHLCGYKVAAAFTCNNFPHELVQVHKGKGITWSIAFDAGKGGEFNAVKYLRELADISEQSRISLPHSSEIDWDDLYRQDKLNDEYLEQCKWRGRLLSATSIQKKAFALYAWKPYARTVITFGKETYSVKVAMDLIVKEMEGEKVQWQSDHEETWNRYTTVKTVANCELYFLHIEKDKFTQERKYLFDVAMPKLKDPILVALSPNNLGDAKALSNALMAQTDFGRFTGGAGDLDWLAKRWSSQNISTVETVPFIGFDETSRSYVFPQAGYQNGRCVLTNKHGYISINKTAIKSTLTGVNFMHALKFEAKILPDFIKVFDMNGVAALGFWTASLFTRQIKERHQFFTFLEVTGEKEAGKSTLIRFLWKMFGRPNYEGIDITTTSTASFGRVLSQLSNLPVVLVESDREGAGGASAGGRPSKSVDWDEFKKIFDLDGILMSRGVKTNDNQTNDSIFRGSLVITQNAMVQGSEAIMSRIVHLHCTTAHKRIENRHIADRLKAMDLQEIAGYLHLAIIHEQAYLDAFFTAFERHRNVLTKSGVIHSQRVIDCHAQVMASVDALQVLFPEFPQDTLNSAFVYLADRAKDRDRRLNADHPVIQQFWETYHYINDQVMTEIDEKGQETERQNEKLNHSLDSKVIAINLNDFNEQCRKRGQKVEDIAELKRLLRTGRHYPFLGDKSIRSRIEKRTVRCMVFSKPSKTLSH